jgi:hypothetical protein
MEKYFYFWNYTYKYQICDSAVSIATGWGLEGQGVGVGVPGRVENGHFSISFSPALGCTQLPIQWVPEALPSGVKWPGREADHSPETSAKVK